MTRQRFRQFSSLIILFSIIAASLPMTAQTRRKPATSGKAPATNTAQQTDPQSVSVFSSEKSAALSAAWQSGELPPPLPIPAGNADEAIALLAKKVAAKNTESIPALLAALQMSGFLVTGKDGKVLLAPPNGKGQGLVVNAWEVASTAKMFGEGKQTTLAEIETGLRAIPALKGAEIESSIVNGLRQNSEVQDGKDPCLRNWARFVVELGKNSEGRSDITARANNAEPTAVNAIQHFLIMRRLYGDIVALAERSKATKSSAKAQSNIGANFIQASFGPRDQNPESLHNFDLSDMNKSISAADKAIPCKLDGDAPVILDAVATALGVGFGELTGYLEDALDGTGAGDALGKYGKIIGIANIILAYAKFLQTYAALETSITLEGASPLVRTKNARPGARNNLKAEVRMNVGNWQVYNCLRTAINLAGIDFAVVNDGPAGGVGVTWHLDEGGAGDVYSNAGGLTGKEQFVGFTQDGARIQNAGTSAGVRGSNLVGNATFTKTDDNGVARIILEGSPQKNAKVGKVMPVMKQAKVRTTVKMKAGDAKGDSVDVAGQVLGGITGLITMPLELLYRMDWASTASLTVPVQDWEECEGGWSGTINYTRKFSDSFGEDGKNASYSGSFSSVKRTRELTVTGKMTLDGKTDPSLPAFGMNFGGQFVGMTPQKGAISVFITESENETFRRGYTDNCSADDIRLKTCQGTSSKRAEVSAADSDGNFSLNLKGETYGLSFRLPEANGTMNSTSQSNCQGFCQKEKNGGGTTAHSDPVRYDKEPVSVENQRFDPENPDRLQGSWSEASRDGKTTITITWDLRKCR